MTVQLANPNQCRPKPEYEDLLFGKHFTDHMLKIAYHKRLGGKFFFSNKILEIIFGSETFPLLYTL
jgi:hypothetical protein